MTFTAPHVKIDLDKTKGIDNMMEITSQELIERILQTDRVELNDVLDAATERFTELWPECELMTISVKGHTGEVYVETLEKVLAYYRKLSAI